MTADLFSPKHNTTSAKQNNDACEAACVAEYNAHIKLCAVSLRP